MASAFRKPEEDTMTDSTTNAPAPGYIQGAVRTALALGGGFLIGKGYVTADQLPELGGAVVGVGVFIWSMVHKSNIAVALSNAFGAGRNFRP
jgi:hypothetical protein